MNTVLIGFSREQHTTSRLKRNWTSLSEIGRLGRNAFENKNERFKNLTDFENLTDLSPDSSGYSLLLQFAKANK